MGETVYAVVYADYEGSTLLWVGEGPKAAVSTVLDCRSRIEDALRAHQEIVGKGSLDEMDAITPERWEELDRRQGEFSQLYDPKRVCVRREEAPYRWECCCGELGLRDVSVDE
jgi:hypothetical protein